MPEWRAGKWSGWTARRLWQDGCLQAETSQLHKNHRVTNRQGLAVVFWRRRFGAKLRLVL